MIPNTSIDWWEYKYIAKHPRVNEVAWDDRQCMVKYPTYSSIYDKKWVNDTFNSTPCWLLDKNELPDKYPVMVKPVTNLMGLGDGAYVAFDDKDLSKSDRNGLMAQSFFHGRHLSTDFVIHRGKVVDWFTFIGHKDYNGSFKLFESHNGYSKRAYEAVEYVAKRGYNGFVNVETIGTNILEMHLRPSLQFTDICDNLIIGYLDQMDSLKKYRHSEYKKTYSKVWRVSKDLKLPTVDIDFFPKGVYSMQLFWEKGMWLSDYTQDNYSYRIMCVNGNNLKSIKRFGNSLLKMLLSYSDYTKMVRQNEGTK